MNVEKLLKKFERIVDELDEDMFTDHPNFEKMKESFEIFEQIVSLVKKDVPVLTVGELEEMFNYNYMFEIYIDGLIDDYSLEDHYKEALDIGYRVLEMFEWPGHSDNDIRAGIVTNLLFLEQYQEACDYAQDWYDEDYTNLHALAMLVNAKVDNEECDEAKLLVQPYLDAECNDETELVLRAASDLYEELYDIEMCRKLNKRLREYEKEVEKELMSLDDDDDEDEDEEDDLYFPFFS